MTPYIHSLHIYPIKSCQGINLDSAELVSTGFKYDRQWMLVDRQGKFLSQRQNAKMALIQTRISDENLVVSFNAQPDLLIPLQTPVGKRMKVTIWNDECEAAIVSSAASAWFQQALDTDCELVFLPDSEKRQVDTQYADPGQIVGFADGFPLLILSLASIDKLNQKLDEKLDITRFRANIVIGGCSAHAEDDWSKISINHIDFLLAKPCSRCVIPNIDQQTGEKHPSVLKTLASYRRRDGKVYMGQNALHLSLGTLSKNQPIFLK